MLSRDAEVLEKKLQDARKLLKRHLSIEELVAVSNYIENVYRSIEEVRRKKINYHIDRVIGDKRKAIHYTDQVRAYINGMREDFCIFKDFHDAYLSEVQNMIQDGIEETAERKYNFTYLKKEELMEIMFGFMRSLHLEKLFDRYLKQGKIYDSRSPYHTDYSGNTLYNPLTGDSDIFLDRYQPTVNMLCTLAHEFGHVADYQLLGIDPAAFNRYFYSSFYQEVLSKTFELLFFDYMFQKGLHVEDTKNTFYNNLLVDNSYVTIANIFTILDDEYIYDGEYETLRLKDLMEMIKDDFDDTGMIHTLLQKGFSFDLGDSMNYSYGHILSHFFVDEIRSEGLRGKLLHEFLQERDHTFRPEFIERMDFSPEKYEKAFQKQIGPLKK